MFSSSLLSDLSWLRYGLSEKHDGSMRCFSAEHVCAAQNHEHRLRYLKRFELDEVAMVIPQLTHSNYVRLVDRDDANVVLSDVDGLVTQEQGLLLTVTVADCLPIYFVDTRLKIIGMVHAGWRGVVYGIVVQALNVFFEQGTRVEDLLVVIGPHIQKQHFEIQDDVKEYFAAWSERIEKHNGKTFVDLSGIVCDQLREHGMLSSRIEISLVSTFDADDYFSYRRDKPEIIETMMAWIMIV